MMSTKRVEIQEKFIITHQGRRGKEQILIEHWKKAVGVTGWCARTEGITTPEDGYSDDDLDNLAELFSAAAIKLREVSEK